MSDLDDLSSAAGSPAKKSEAGSEPDVMDTDDRVGADRQEEDDLKEDLDDLFGDDDEDIQTDKVKKRRLDDEELDSGDDMERNDRLEHEEEDVAMEIPEEITTTDVQLNRHHALRGSDGEVYLLHQQNFTGIEPTAFDPDTFSPPKGPHNSQEAPGPQFSAAQTAASTIRWRRSPRDASALQSNARIVRWSDGSLTLQIASNPTEQYELPATARAAPQLRPTKPTPISKPLKKGVQPRTITDKDNYHLYLCSVHEDTGYARVTNHVTVSLAVRSTRTTRDENVDDATLKLQEIMAKNAANRQNLHKSRVISTKEDPLEAQRRAIKADKELAKAVRQKQLKEEKELAKRHGAMGNAATYGRSGGSGYGRYDDDRPKSKVPRKKANRSRYSDDEDDRRGRTREDEYDEEDDFIAPSDEDGEDIGGDDDDEEEEEILDDDVDAEGEADDDAPAPAPAPAAAPSRVERTDSEAAGAARNKRRQVIDDDDDDE